MNRRQVLTGLVGLPWLSTARAEERRFDAQPVLGFGDPTDDLVTAWVFDPAGPPRLWTNGRAVPLRALGPETWAADLRRDGRPLRVTAETSSGTMRQLLRPGSASGARRFVVGADLFGQGYGHGLDPGAASPPSAAMAAERADALLLLGDRIYADNAIPAEVRLPDGATRRQRVDDGRDHPAITLDDFRGAWRYALRDPAWRDLVAGTPMIAVWDDHEVVDNQGPGIPLGPAYGDTAIDALLAAGRRAFWEHTPWRQPLEGPFWRALPMGRHVEILALDGRSHRTPVLGDASPADRWLGAAQAAWLADRLAHPTTTWQIVLLSQPIGAVIHHDWRARTGSDGVADGTAASGGREDELRAALAASPDLSRVLVLAADVHCPGWYRYDLPNGPLHELVTGALFALNLPPPTRDPTFPGEVLWERRLTAPQPPLPEWQSYAIVDVDAEGALSARWMTGDGRTEFTARLPTPT